MSPCLLSPVGPHKLVSVGLQEQPSQHVLHAAANVALGDAPQPGVHAQGLAACHVVQEGIELRAVADPLLDLGARGTQRGLAHRQVSARRCPSQKVPWHPQGFATSLQGFCSKRWGLSCSSETAGETRRKFLHCWSSQSGRDGHTQRTSGRQLRGLTLCFPSWFLIVRGHFRWPRLSGDRKHWKVCTFPISQSPLGTRAQQKAESQGRKQAGPRFQGRPSPCSPCLTLSGVDSGRGIQGLN